MVTLILGGVRSGKSRLAQSLAIQGALPVTYIATATGNDAEMRARIKLHRAHRPPHWTVIEEPIALGDILQERLAPSRCVIVDCLTLWLTNLLLSCSEKQLQRQTAQLLAVLTEQRGDVILVGNETGLGIIPGTELSRRFCDNAGLLHQQLTDICDRVILTVAGLPLLLKGEAL